MGRSEDLPIINLCYLSQWESPADAYLSIIETKDASCHPAVIRRAELVPCSAVVSVVLGSACS